MGTLSFLDRERTVAPPGYSRWLIPPAALAVHLSIGQVYAFSVFKQPLQDHFGTQGTPIAVIFSIAIVMLGLSAAFGGTWVERNGPRRTMVAAALCFSGGLFIGAAGVAADQLWLVYLGYGVIGGIGLGLGYISPVSTLIKWFPDRPGLATGLAIMGFGGGALIASPLSDRLLNTYGVDPASAIAPAFLTLGALYLVLMLLGAFVVKVPAKDWRPDGWTPSEHSSGLRSAGDVTARNAIRTPQFWLLWVVLFTNVTAGIGILETASPMVRTFFPDISVAAAAGYVGVLSLCNMAGRFVWSSTSDVIGRKRIYMLYLGVGAVLYLGAVLLGTTSVVVFVLLTGIILSFYGGGFATIPAYLKDLFGGLQVGAIHGRLLTAWSAAGGAGPLIVNSLVDAAGGESGGAGAYRLPLSVMVGVLVVGFIANALVRPVDPTFHEPSDRARSDDSAAATTVPRERVRSR
ncbi:Nitrate/nitrite transporter NarK [Quadrisphaera granulorum]|uniref:Nitrate/nitrite transporter NarK n=1 Tax=Quadrisphaera granulorum TaxID=317664 RepID=A0A316A504_9ACTN|nr:OFA family MFS transporter [Quadrisphaera granulorum]PWJ52775.1 nitrate/nitrite transporter NarK [Quadrisphaera granulorum]SZE97380.1 Nitrate/nitrite transporter NarK [Quadrisphaera granulorum]